MPEALAKGPREISALSPPSLRGSHRGPPSPLTQGSFRSREGTCLWLSQVWGHYGAKWAGTRDAKCPTTAHTESLQLLNCLYQLGWAMVPSCVVKHHLDVAVKALFRGD